VKLKWLFAVMIGIVGLTGTANADDRGGQQRIAPMQPDMGCTVVYATDGEIALGGNNEDYGIPLTRVFFLPAEEGAFGRVYFGYENFIWSGGMNDQGLFFDAMAVDQPVSVPREGKPVYEGTLADKAMAECATVDCVVALFEQYHTYDTWYHQYLFGDAEGSSVIIEPLAILYNEGGYQVGTNFYQSTTPEQQRTCPRYRTATRMLADADAISVDLIRDVMDATHLGGQSQTLYSNVYDLTNRIAYVYYFHDYDHVAVLDLEQELADGRRALDLSTLFPPNPAAESWSAPILRDLEEQRAGRTTADVDPAILETYVGQYDIPEDMHYSYPYPFFGVTLDGNTLYLQIKTDKGWYPLTPESETQFFHLSVMNDFSVAFQRGESGSIEHMLYREGGREYLLPRVTTEQPASAPGEALPITGGTPVRPHGFENGNDFNWITLTSALLLLALGAWMAWRGFRRRSALRSLS
jgi:hypothetical protein